MIRVSLQGDDAFMIFKFYRLQTPDSRLQSLEFTTIIYILQLWSQESGFYNLGVRTFFCMASMRRTRRQTRLHGKAMLGSLLSDIDVLALMLEHLACDDVVPLLSSSKATYVAAATWLSKRYNRLAHESDLLKRALDRENGQDKDMITRLRAIDYEMAKLRPMSIRAWWASDLSTDHQPCSIPPLLTTPSAHPPKRNANSEDLVYRHPELF